MRLIHVLRLVLMAACLAITARGGASAAPKLLLSGEKRAEYLSDFEGVLMREREAANLPKLVRSRFLDIVAQAHAEDMARRAYFAHSSPEGEDAEQRILRLIPQRIIFATRENLAMEAATRPDPIAVRAADAHRYLMNSPGHRANILNDDSTHVGLGVATVFRDGKFFEYAVQVFAIEVGNWAATVPQELPRRFAGAAFPISLDRKDIEFIVQDVDEPDRTYPDPVIEGRRYYGWAPVRMKKGGGAIIFPEFEPGKYSLHARIKTRGPGFYEVRPFRVE